jgi:hypothetical protein
LFKKELVAVYKFNRSIRAVRLVFLLNIFYNQPYIILYII